MNSRIFQKYYEQLRLPLGMFSLRFTLSVEAAEDIVQSVFLEIWDKFNDEKEPDNFKSYIYRAVRNASLNWCRDNGRMETIPIEYYEEQQSEEVIDTSELDARLWQAIDNLPEKCRRIFLMSKRDAMPNAEIADTLGISIKTVENQMTKAFSRLRGDRKLSSSDFWFLTL